MNTAPTIADIMITSAALLFPMGVVFFTATIAEVVERISK